MKHFDYIFTGGGLAALSTAVAIAENGGLQNKSVLIIDSDPKDSNDRTWCFWEKSECRFSGIAVNSWSKALFSAENETRILDLSPYRYKRIRSADFYQNAKKRLDRYPNIEWLIDAVTDFSDVGKLCSVTTTSAHFTCGKIFNSILNWSEIDNSKFPLLQQHFKGWFVKAKQPSFDTEIPTFMDFSIPQKGNTRFMYVLPFSATEALVEYTLFSHDLLPEIEYDNAIADYLKIKNISDYEIIETEKGSIPMTVFPFWKNNTKNSINIGSAGGWTKASTGYTFRNTMRKSAELAEFLKTESDLKKFHKSSRFDLYDMLMLDVLDKHNEQGSAIFSSMFRRGNPALILKFLDQETSLFEDIQVILKCPTALFLSAALKRIFR